MSDDKINQNLKDCENFLRELEVMHIDHRREVKFDRYHHINHVHNDSDDNNIEYQEHTVTDFAGIKLEYEKTMKSYLKFIYASIPSYSVTVHMNPSTKTITNISCNCYGERQDIKRREGLPEIVKAAKKYGITLDIDDGCTGLIEDLKRLTGKA